MRKQNCQVCGEQFDVKELYPVALIRSNVFQQAEKKYPNLTREGFVCLPDFRKISGLYFEEILNNEKGVLTELEQEVLDSLKQHELLSENVNKEFEEQLTLGERVADKIAKFGGSWTFIIMFISVLIIWMGFNTLMFLREPFDPYPFILLNLVLSTLAAIQAPVIMMSQNRQSEKDRLSQENGYQINLKSELQIRHLNARLELFMKHHWQKMHELSRLQEELVEEVEELRRKKF